MQGQDPPPASRTCRAGVSEAGTDRMVEGAVAELGEFQVAQMLDACRLRQRRQWEAALGPIRLWDGQEWVNMLEGFGPAIVGVMKLLNNHVSC